MKPRLFLLVLIFIYSVLSAYAGNFLPLRLVKGDSMEPVLYTGDVILLKSAPFSDIARGDVIAYRIPDATSTDGKPVTILHRVMRAEAQNGERVLLTKGDNSAIDPWPVTSSLVRGKLGFRLPWIGRPILFLATSRAALVTSLALASLLLALYRCHAGDAARILQKAPSTGSGCPSCPSHFRKNASPGPRFRIAPHRHRFPGAV